MLRYIAGFLFLAALAFSFEDSLTALHLSKPDFEAAVSKFAVPSLARGVSGYPRVPDQPKSLFLAMNDSARASVVKELGLAAKALILSPAFESAYNAHLKAEYKAVNHGIVVKDVSAGMEAAVKSGNAKQAEDEASAMLRKAYQPMVIDMLKQVGSFDATTLPLMTEAVKGYTEILTPANAAEKAQHAKALVLLAEVAKLTPTNLPAAREKFKTAAMLSVFLDPANAGSVETDLKKQEEQANYNRLALKVTLKKELLAFVTLAKTVDFKAATQPRNKKVVFVDPAMERKPGLWKLLYRVGPGGTAAAISIAQGWAGQL